MMTYTVSSLHSHTFRVYNNAYQVVEMAKTLNYRRTRQEIAKGVYYQVKTTW